MASCMASRLARHCAGVVVFPTLSGRAGSRRRSGSKGGRKRATTSSPGTSTGSSVCEMYMASMTTMAGSSTDSPTR